MANAIKTSQVRLRRIHVKVNGTAATPVASGVDKFLVASIDDLGVGNYKINLTGKAFARNNNPLDVIGFTAIGDVALFQVDATDRSSITISAFEADGVTPKDVDFGVEFQANDFKNLVGY